jgi:hypothetical protein
MKRLHIRRLYTSTRRPAHTTVPRCAPWLPRCIRPRPPQQTQVRPLRLMACALRPPPASRPLRPVHRPPQQRKVVLRPLRNPSSELRSYASPKLRASDALKFRDRRLAPRCRSPFACSYMSSFWYLYLCRRFVDHRAIGDHISPSLGPAGFTPSFTSDASLHFAHVQGSFGDGLPLPYHCLCTARSASRLWKPRRWTGHPRTKQCGHHNTTGRPRRRHRTRASSPRRSPRRPLTATA